MRARIEDGTEDHGPCDIYLGELGDLVVVVRGEELVDGQAAFVRGRHPGGAGLGEPAPVRHAEGPYPVYRYQSSYAHASLQTGEAFVERGPRAAPALYRTGKVPVGESRAWIPVCL
ncbi:hypothetical protein [Streptomyces sp. NPDC056524]|uniref:hypothetical protein n=1 Tax=Streptomyces sp. NPDC056524 TaxID=3345851 RepID=UPI00368A9C89